MKKTIIIASAVMMLISLAAACATFYILRAPLEISHTLTVDPVPEKAQRHLPGSPSDAQAEPPAEPVSVTLSFVGDCMLATDRGGEYAGSFNKLAREVNPSYFFENFDELFGNDDWTVANLENVFTDDPDAAARAKNHSPAYWYKSSTKNTDILTEGNIEIVSLANNHSQDYGDTGYRDTRNALSEAGILYGDDSGVLILEKDGFRVALYCCTYWYNGYERIIIDKMAETEADYKIVYFHGGTERVHVPDEWKAAGARRMIDGGIDTVIGGHPHVLQPIEEYKGKTIVHSLGNFCFGGSRNEENRTIVYRLTLTSVEGTVTDVTSEVIPCYVYTDLYKPGIITDEDEIAAVNAFLYEGAESPMGDKK